MKSEKKSFLNYGFMVNHMNNNFWVINNPPPLVAGTGLLTIDIIKNNVENQPPISKAGGSFGNVITILSYLGWDAYPIARLGNDDIAIKIKDDLNKFNVNLNYIMLDKSTKTPLIIENVGNDKSNKPKHSFRLSCPNCNSWFPRYKPLTLNQVDELIPKIPSVSVFYFDRLAPAVLKLAEFYHKRGALIIFEPAKISDIKLLSKCLKMCHILKYQEGSLKGHEELIRNSNLPLEIETLGSEGLRYRFKTRNLKISKWFKLKTYDIGEIKDAAGAGDWCSAGLIHIFGQYGSAGFLKLNQKDYLRAFNFCQALAAFACKFEGARGGMYLLKKDDYIKNINSILNKEKLQIIYKNNLVDETENIFCSKCKHPL